MMKKIQKVFWNEVFLYSTRLDSQDGVIDSTKGVLSIKLFTIHSDGSGLDWTGFHYLVLSSPLLWSKSSPNPVQIWFKSIYLVIFVGRPEFQRGQTNSNGGIEFINSIVVDIKPCCCCHYHHYYLQIFQNNFTIIVHKNQIILIIALILNTSILYSILISIPHIILVVLLWLLACFCQLAQLPFKAFVCLNNIQLQPISRISNKMLGTAKNLLTLCGHQWNSEHIKSKMSEVRL